VVLVELGVHNPLAAEIGVDGEGEMTLAKRLLSRLPANSLLIADRWYGVGAFLCEFLTAVQDARAEMKLRTQPRQEEEKVAYESKVARARNRAPSQRQIPRTGASPASGQAGQERPDELHGPGEPDNENGKRLQAMLQRAGRRGSGHSCHQSNRPSV